MENLIIGLENFRIFKEKTFFDIKPLTILTGTNNSGKSTLIKSLLLLKEAFRNSEVPYFEFTSDNHKLNSYSLSINNENINNENPLLSIFQYQKQF